MISERQEPGRPEEASGEARAPGPHPARQRPWAKGPPPSLPPGRERSGRGVLLSRPPPSPRIYRAGLGAGEGNGGRGAGEAPRLRFQVSALHNRVGLGGQNSLPTCAVSGVSPPAF